MQMAAYEKMHVLIRPKGIAWDERDNTIYVGDANNYRIRKIGLEEDVPEEDINE